MEAKLFIFAAVAISEVFSACSPKNTKFIDFQSNPKRSKPFVVEVFSKRCPGLQEFYYKWKIEELTEEKALIQTSVKSSIYIEGYSFDSKRCYIISYLLSVSVSHYPDMSFANAVEGVFRFEPDLMHVEILGGIKRGHLYGNDLVVDARTLSADTSYPPNEYDFEGDDIKWTVVPEIKGFELTDELVQNIPSEMLRLGDVYNFTVVITRTKIPQYEDVQKSTQIVTIVSRSTPDINLRCIRNCVAPLSWESTAFEVQCLRNCKNLRYTWFVEPEPPEDKITLGTGYDKIIIENGAFDEGDQIFVTFMAGDTIFTQSLTFVSGLEQGNCTINPDRGISGVTKFHISCKGFSSPFGLARCMIFQQFGEDEGDMVLLDEYSYKDETVMYLPPSDPAYVTITVEDHAFLQVEVTLKVIVDEFQLDDNLPNLSGVKKLVLSRDSTSITSYSLEGLNNQVVQMTCCLLAAIKAFKFDDMSTRDLHKHMVEAITRSSPVRLSSAYQRVLMLCKVQKYKLKTDTITARLIGRGLLYNALSAHILFSHTQNRFVPHFYIHVVYENSLTLTSELLQQSDEIINVLQYEIPPHDYDSYDEFVAQKIQIREDYSQILNDAVVALHTNTITVLFRTIPDEDEFVYRTDMILIQAKRKLLSTIRNDELKIQFYKLAHEKVILPPKLIQDLRKNYTFIDYQFGVFLKNPFWWHRNVSKLNTRVCLFDLFSKCAKIKKYAAPIELHLELVSVPKEEINGTMTYETIAPYKVELEHNVTLVVEFFNEGQYPHKYLVTWSYCVCTEDDFSSTRSKVITTPLPEIHRSFRVENPGDTPHVYICIKKLTPKLSYRLILTTYSCMNWDLATRKWHKEGCKVINPHSSMSDKMTCRCYHSSLFVGEASKPIISYVSNAEIAVTIGFVKNYVMVMVIIGFILLWVVSLILAHWRDKSMKKKNVVHKLDDNVPGDSNPYLVVVFTGIYYDAQTTADVAFKLIGKLSQSRTHVIKCQGTTLLKRNSQDWLMIYSPTYLGHLKKIKIWHNCKGRYPHWYCDRVIVQDLKVGEQYCFTVKKWFSVIWGSGRIYREILLKRRSMKIPKLLFLTQFEKDLKNEHIWMSVLTRDIQSNFNSKERVSTGFCFLFLSMLANAMLLSAPHDAPLDSIDQQNSFDVEAENIIVLIESWLVATPLSFLIYFIFKNSAPL